MAASIEDGRDGGAELIVTNGRISTQDGRGGFASAAAIRDGRFAAVGDERGVMRLRGERTQLIELGAARSSPASTTRTCTRSAAASTTTWS